MEHKPAITLPVLLPLTEDLRHCKHVVFGGEDEEGLFCPISWHIHRAKMFSPLKSILDWQELCWQVIEDRRSGQSVVWKLENRIAGLLPVQN